MKSNKFNVMMKKKIIESNIDVLRKFQLRIMFLNIKLVYCELLFKFFCRHPKKILLNSTFSVHLPYIASHSLNTISEGAIKPQSCEFILHPTGLSYSENPAKYVNVHCTLYIVHCTGAINTV